MFSRWSSPEAAISVAEGNIARNALQISGISDYRMIDENGGIQWPLKESEIGDGRSEMGKEIPQERRLFEDGRFYTPDRVGRDSTSRNR